MKKINYPYAVLLSLIFVVFAFSQQATLSADAEYKGLFLDKTKPIKFYRNGEFQSGTLKTDYISGEMTFATGTVISFFKDGTISSGELLTGFKIKDINFAPGKIAFHNNGKVQTAIVEAGSAHRNLKVPLKIEVAFSREGIIERFNASLTYFYNVLGMTIRGTGVEFAYDEKTETYKLYSGTNHAPQLAGALMITRNRIAQPLNVEPIVMPIDSVFTYFSNRAPLLGQDLEYDSRWSYNGTFIVNKMNFGKTPFLWFKGNRLMAIQVTQPVTVQTYTFTAGEIIILDDAGNVIPTQFINP